MDRKTERDVEKLLRGSVFPDPSHRAALHRRLFEGTEELKADDLEGVVGGVMGDTLLFEKWPEDPWSTLNDRPWSGCSWADGLF